jgi:cytosine/adenosine deaminase-related metal-dependent hydrolase
MRSGRPCAATTHDASSAYSDIGVAMADLIVAGACVVTMNSARKIYSDGAIAISGKKIAAVGPSAEILAAHTAPHTISARGMLAVPGLIDAHNHPNQYLSNGIGDDVDIFTWIRRVYPYESVLTAEEAYLSALGAFTESIRHGTTCFNDPGGIHPDAMAQAALDVGIRGIVNRSTRDSFDESFPTPENLKESTESCLRNGEEFVTRWNGAGDGRLRAWFSLRTMFNVSEELCRGIKALADRYRVGIHSHASTIRAENDFVRSRTGKRSLAWLSDLGVLGPNLCLIHMGDTQDDEIPLLTRHDCKVVHCPSASMLGGYGVIHNRIIPRMIDAGVTVGLGTDSATAGGHLDMVRMMYLAACAHKDAYADATKMGARKALEMATIDGARACLWDDTIGSLEPGKLADISLFDMSGIHWHPGRDPVMNLVYSATGRDADTVIIDGRIVMRHGVMATVDESWLGYELARATSEWRTRAGLHLSSPWAMA